MKRLWIISGAITLTLTIAVSQFETKAPEGWGFVHCTSTNKNCGRLECPMNELLFLVFKDMTTYV